MSTATLETTAPVQTDDDLMAQLEQEEKEKAAAPTPGTEEKAAPDVDLTTDQKFSVRLKRIRTLADRERRLSLRNRLHIAEDCAIGMEEMVAAYATDHDSRKKIRASAAKVIALELTAGYGTATDDKEVYRLAKAHRMANLLPTATRKTLDRLCWDATRTLTRWVRDHEEEYALAFQVDVGVKDDNGSTLRTVDATELLSDLIENLAASPKSSGTIRKLLDTAENDARKAELSFLTSRDQKKAAAAHAMAERIAGRKERTAMFDSFAQKIVKWSMTPEEVTAELYRAEILQGATADFDPSQCAELTPDDARTIGRLLLQAKNFDAINAIAEAINPVLVAVATDTQPSKATGTIMGRQIA